MSFGDRIENDQKLSEIVEDFFSRFLDDKVFFNEVGQETNLLPIHEHIRYKRDVTSEFMRFLPDAFVCWSSGENEQESWFLDLKVAKTGFELDEASPLLEMRKSVVNLKKEEILRKKTKNLVNGLLLVMPLSKQGILFQIVLSFINWRISKDSSMRENRV